VALAGVLVIANLVLREASRRRLLLALVLLTLALIALNAWGFAQLPRLLGGDDRPLPRDALTIIASQLLILVAFMFSFILALTAVFAAAPSISGEIESGIAQPVVARPLSRISYVLGKWIGLVVVLLGYTVGAVALELLVVRVVVDYVPPYPLEAFAYVFAEGVVLLTLALALSTRLSGMVAGVVCLVLFGMAWMGGIVGGIGLAFGNPAITHVGTVTKLLVPTDGLWRGAVNALEPVAMLVGMRGAPVAATAANPFFAASAPPLPFVAWSLLWIAVVLAAGVWSFRSREI
jgi:ABC-type transport system involved in multi-copper enzyme maturation permease subunit